MLANLAHWLSLEIQTLHCCESVSLRCFAVESWMSGRRFCWKKVAIRSSIVRVPRVTHAAFAVSFLPLVRDWTRRDLFGNERD